MQLTDKQKELFQLDKYILVDNIIILEGKVAKLDLAHRADLQTISELMDEIKFSENEMLLSIEGLKTELEIERSMRVKLEKAHITAQEELDELGADVKSMSKLSNDAFLHALQDKIDKYYQTALTEREKEIEAFEEHCKDECYACATQRHACEHDSLDDSADYPEAWKEV
jgi:hypothetical protein